MILSVTERQTFKRCRRKWDLSSYNRQSLSPAQFTSGALDLGTLVHKSLADWIIDRTYTREEAAALEATEGAVVPLPEIFKMHSAARLAEIEQNYAKITGGAKPGPNEFDTLFEIIDLGIHMMENYVEFHGTPLPKHMTFAHPEQKVRIPIPNTRCERCNGVGRSLLDDAGVACFSCDGLGQHLLEATLDGLVQDRRGRLYVLEHKTYGRRPKMETLDTSDQFLGYQWVLTKLNFAPVGGVAYDGMWKRSQPPRGASMQDLFLRTVLTRTSEELAEFEAQLAQEANDMASIHANVPVGKDSPVLYINRQWQGCNDCGYLKLCRTMSMGEDVEYVKKTYYTIRTKEGPLALVGADEED